MLEDAQAPVQNGLLINQKRTLRIHRALALNLPRRLKKRVLARVKQTSAVPKGRQWELGARLYARWVDRWSPVPHAQRARQLRTDNDQGFISAQSSEWCEQYGISRHLIQPGKPTQNDSSELLAATCSTRTCFAR